MFENLSDKLEAIRKNDTSMWVEIPFRKVKDKKKEIKHRGLIKACKFIEDYTGNCPYNSLDFDMDCENRCSADIEVWTCWYDYFDKNID